VPVGTRLRRRPQATTPLVELPRQCPIALADRVLVDHARLVRRTPRDSFKLFYDGP